mmetsp:Transcript_14124/g.58981  ORF Transcript_14124/g.58981 Transcript_14124/m.58981 type:complete len:214 (-) Transcript_14124:1797-2438(-)
MWEHIARRRYLPAPSVRARAGALLAAASAPPSISIDTAPLKSASAARSMLLSHCSRARLASGASNPIATSISTDSAGGSGLPPPPAPAGAAGTMGASMSGSSMCSSSQFIAMSAFEFCVASAAFWQRISGKPIDASCATMEGSACGAAAAAGAASNATASAEPSSGSASSPGRTPPSPGERTPSVPRSSSSGTSSSTSSLVGTQLSPTTNFFT